MNQKLCGDKLAALSYTPPQFNWTRPDPRGAEYGTYGVRMVCNGDIYVTYYPHGSAIGEFSFYFNSVDSFERWTKHTF
jgi:hypothetical protein